MTTQHFYQQMIYTEGNLIELFLVGSKYCRFCTAAPTLFTVFVQFPSAFMTP